MADVVACHLERAGYDVQRALSREQGERLYQSSHPDLVILEPDLPDADGFDLCRAIRRRDDTPVIMLSARTGQLEKPIGLHLGADDYLSKPFNPLELVARVDAVLRRTEANPDQSPVVTFGDLRLDQQTREVRLAGRPISLLAREFDLLLAFGRLPGIVLHRQKLLALAWGTGAVADERIIDVYVTWLRKKLRASNVRIETVRGVGYRLALEAASCAPVSAPSPG